MSFLYRFINLKFSEDFRIFENFFDMPGEVLAARVVDVKDKEVYKLCFIYSNSLDLGKLEFCDNIKSTKVTYL